MIAPQNCPQCGADMPPDSPQGLCPKCLLQVGVESHASNPSGGSGTAQTTPYRSGFVPPTPAELSARFPQFEILELLGRGGMGMVYKARQIALDRMVALKILPPEVGQDAAFAERFAREARALARLNHPGIVGVYDFGQVDGLYYFVMEYVDGANVRRLIQSGGLTPKEALAIVPQICDALQFAHDEGVVHRDIKPENLLVDKKGRVKIADFGLAKLLGLAAEDFNLTHAQQVMGTPHYMAPEQIEKPLTVDHRTDIYALGVVFYEMLTGELPLGRFAPPSKKVQIDVRLDEIVMRALENKPELRYQHASEVKTDVQTVTGISPAVWRQAFGKEYRSKTTLFGLPLLHVALGFDPATGKKRIAKGIIAIGDVAIGVVALGGVAAGGLCFGGCAFGLFVFAGLAAGLLAVGGMALGGFAFGGIAVGGVAVGGVAVGLYAYGGLGIGAHVLAGNSQDPVGIAFFDPWAHNWWKWLTAMVVLLPLFQAVVWFFVWRLLRKQEGGNADSRNELRAFSNRMPRVCLWQLLFCVVGLIPAAIPAELMDRGLWGIGSSSSGGSFSGVSISDVRSNSAAYRAGLRDRDLVLSINDSTVQKNDDISRFWMEVPVGTAVALKVERASKEIELHTTVGPAAVAARGYRGYQILTGIVLGASIAMIVTSLRLPRIAPWRGVIIAATAGFALVVTLCNATEWIQVVQNISYGDPGQFVDENLQRFSIMGIMALLLGLAVLDIRTMWKGDPRPRLEITNGMVAAVGGAAFAVSILGAILTLNTNVSTVYFNYVAIPLIVVAALGATFVYFRQKSNPAAGWKGEVPEMTIFFLGAAAGAIPWGVTGFLQVGTAWRYWHGTVFSLIYLVLGLMAIILSGRGRHSLGQTVATLLSGLAAFGIIVAFGEWPPVIGSSDFSIDVGKNGFQPGYFVAATVAILTALLGALQLRENLQVNSAPRSSP